MHQVSRTARRAAIVAVLAVALASCGGGGGDGESGGSGTGGMRSERGLAVGETIEVGDRPVGIMRGPGGVWVASTPVTVIEPQRREVREQVEVPEAHGAVVTEHTSWIPGVAGKPDGSPATNPDGAVAEIDVHSFRVRSYIPVGGRPDRVAVAPTTVWVTDPQAKRLTVLEVDTSQVLGTVDLDVAPGEIAFGKDAVWVTAADGDPCRCLLSVDPGRGEVTGTFDLGSAAQRITGVVVTRRGVWVTATSGDGASTKGLLLQVDAETGKVTRTIELGRSATGVAAGGGTVWVTDCLAGTLTGVDEATGDTVKGPTEVADPAPAGAALDGRQGGCPAALVAVQDVVWVANRNAGTVVPVTAAA